MAVTGIVVLASVLIMTNAGTGPVAAGPHRLGTSTAVSPGGSGTPSTQPSATATPENGQAPSGQPEAEPTPAVEASGGTDASMTLTAPSNPDGTDGTGGTGGTDGGGGSGGSGGLSVPAGPGTGRNDGEGSGQAGFDGSDGQGRWGEWNDQDGRNDQNGQAERVRVSVAPFDSQERVYLSSGNTVDWVVFGGPSTVQARADIRHPLIGTSRVGRGRSVGGFTNRFFWTDGTPIPAFSDDIDRAEISGEARFDVTLGSPANRLDLYVGSAHGQIEVTIGSGRNARSTQLRLSASHPGRDPDGIVSVYLPGGNGSLQVTLSPVGRGSFTLAAAVLR